MSVYQQILQALKEEGVTDVQIDEAKLVTDLSPWETQAFRSTYKQLSEVPINIMLTTYFGGLGDNLSLAVDLHTAGVHIDLARAPHQLDEILNALAPNQTLSLGLVNGRNIWLTDFAGTNPLIEQAVATCGVDRIIVSTSCSLLHVPHDLAPEKKLNPHIKGWLRFASEKLTELVDLASGNEAALVANKAAVTDRETAESSKNIAVRNRIVGLTEVDFTRNNTYPHRAAIQQKKLNLPLLPTTTIGSFPQTADVRKHRTAFKNGHIDQAQYDAFLRDATEYCIREQERIGLDVLVHGEFERNDMVEYFAAFLEGFAFTESGWVQSYGSRCVKEFRFGEVSLPEGFERELEFTILSYAREAQGRCLESDGTSHTWFS